MNTLQIPVMDAIQDYTSNMVRILSEKYVFDYKEATRYIRDYRDPSTKRITEVSDSESCDSDTSIELESESLSESKIEMSSEPEPETEPEPHIESEQKTKKTKKTEKTEYPKTIFPLPFIGIVYDSCFGIRNNSSLFTQCPYKPDEKSKRNFCKTCQKQADKNTHNKPNCGTIQDRSKVPYEEFRDPRGKKPITLGKYIVSKKISIADVQKEFTEKNITIPDFLWQETLPGEKPKGKKSNNKSSSSTQSIHTIKEIQQKESDKLEPELEEEEEAESESESESEAIQDKTDSKPQEVETDEIFEDVEVAIQPITIHSKKYLIDNDDDLYDIDTEIKIGTYDHVSDEIIFDEAN